MVSVYNDAPREDRPGIVAEVVRFARDTLAALHPELLDQSAQMETGSITDTISDRPKRGKEAAKAKEASVDDWISTDSEDGIMEDILEAGPRPKSSTALIQVGASVALRPRLDRLIAPLSHDLSTERMEDIMAQFRDRLVALGEFPITRGKKASTSLWSDARATSLVNHIFTEMISNLKGRLQPIVNSYTNVDPQTGVSSRTAVLANEASTRDGYPRLVRVFCLAVAKGIEMDSANSAGYSLLRQVNEFRKFQALETLKRRAAEHDEEILNFLKRQGLQAERGRMWVSVMVTFLVDLFEIGTRRQLNNLCTSGKAISTLVEVFGFGSLALLHATSTRK